MIRILLSLLVLSGLGWCQEVLRIEKSTVAMGTTYTIAAYGTNRAKLIAAVDNALEEATRLDQVLSNYKPDSELSRLNREAPERWTTVTPELFDLVQACLDYSRRSEGTFDITVGKLVKAWGFYKGSGHLPHRAEIRSALGKVGYRFVETNPSRHEIRFTRNLELDPGGIGKGYAVDRMVNILKNAGVTVAYVTGGGSSVYGLGAPPTEPRGWPVAIRNPRNVEKTVETVYLKNMSMSTSGSYERFFKADGKVYSHIFDPRTGYPAQGSLSVSVISPRTIDSEAWTKPYFIQGAPWARRHSNGFRVFFCEDKPGTSCAWLQ